MSRLHKGGRPPKRKTERLGLLLSDTEYLNCQRAAEIRGVSMAEILRDGLERVIRHMKSQGQWDTVPPAEARDNGMVYGKEVPGEKITVYVNQEV